MKIPQARSPSAIARMAVVIIAAMTSSALALPVAWNVDIHQDKYGPDPPNNIANDFHIWGVLESGLGGGDPPTLTSSVNFQTTGPNGIPPFQLVPAGLQFAAPAVTIGGVPGRPLPPQYNGPALPSPPFYYFESSWSGTNIPYCTWMHFGLQFEETCHNIGYWLQGVWTKDGVDPAQQPIYGFEVRDGIGQDGNPTGEPQKIRIQNASQVETTVDQMQMLILPANQTFNLADLNTDYFSQHPEFVWHTVPTALLPTTSFPGTSSFFDVFLDQVPGLGALGPGETLLARQYGSYQGGSTDYFWQYELHGAHVPEPGSAVLLVLGGLAVTLSRRR